ncbi:MAG: hypothetical protein JWN86_2234 [Planctomycetota bacterium]|nr:hypothetical protein [Planctomycetota bacterium]
MTPTILLALISISCIHPSDEERVAAIVEKLVGRTATPGMPDQFIGERRLEAEPIPLTVPQDDEEEEAPKGDQTRRIALKSACFDFWVFGNMRHTQSAWMKVTLKRRLNLYGTRYRLTEPELAKLHLAGKETSSTSSTGSRSIGRYTKRRGRISRRHNLYCERLQAYARPSATAPSIRARSSTRCSPGFSTIARRPVRTMRLPRPRLSVRLMMALVAVAALVFLGMIWAQKSSRHHAFAASYAAREANNRRIAATQAAIIRSRSKLIAITEGLLAGKEGQDPRRAAQYQEELARERETLAVNRRGDEVVGKKLAHFAEMRKKHERIARSPWLPVVPDPPEPE